MYSTRSGCRRMAPIFASALLAGLIDFVVFCRTVRANAVSAFTSAQALLDHRLAFAAMLRKSIGRSIGSALAM